MKSGVTVFAQVRVRNRNTDRNKVHYEAFYMKKSILFDLKIIIIVKRTFFKFSNINN
jgi:lipopolysaccharide/colanic/teichoic acid biosynthesis glycosyltransferase